MIIHEYICDKCGNLKDVLIEHLEPLPKNIKCDKCNSKEYMHKNYGGIATVIPAHMRASTPYGDSDTFSTAKQMITRKHRRRTF